MIVSSNWFKCSTAEGSTYIDSTSSAIHGLCRPFEDKVENRIWDRERKQKNSWSDYEPYLQRLSTTDQLIAWYRWHEGWTQWGIADMLNWSHHSCVRARLLRIARQLKLLMREPLVPADLKNCQLTDIEKFLLLEYHKCLGNYSAVVKRLSWCQKIRCSRYSGKYRCQKYSFTVVYSNLRKAKQKLPKKILDKVTFPDLFCTPHRHGSFIHDPLPTRN